MARYEWLRHWALRLAGNATDADDLLHDAFLQFVVRRRDLSEIDNLDGYLYGMLRRLRLSKRRAVLRAREDSLAALDYDTAALSLRAADPRDALRLEQELRQVCAWACRRKNTSKSGSVLLLRFFHGFFPGEIARILKCPLRGANDWLRIARREVRAFLADPPPVRHDTAMERDDVLDVLRSTVWAARTGACLDAAALARLYGSHSTHAVSCRTLAHIVACRDCLAHVSVLLGMRGPGDRDPHDMLGQDTSWRMARAVREHVPHALRVAVNGLPIGGRRIDGERCAFTLACDLDEPIEFVEVFSEQGVRLLHCEMAAPSADRLNRCERVEFEQGRALAASIHFDRPRPLIRVEYTDPSWAAAADESCEPCDRVVPFAVGVLEPALRARVSDALGGLRWPRLRPVVLTLTLGALLAFATPAPWRSEPVSAAQLLAGARALELHAAAAPQVVVRRVLRFEERTLPSRAVRTRHRIEVWHHAHTGLTARHRYDEGGQRVAGVADNAWLWEPSAVAFLELGGRDARVEEAGNRYVLQYTPPGPPVVAGLVHATLVMAKDPLRPIEQTVVMREGEETRELRVVEAERAEVALADVPPSAFAPERGRGGPDAALTPPTPAKPRSRTRRPVADDLAIDALFAMHRLKACVEDRALPLKERVLREAQHLDELTARWPADVLARLDADRAAAWQDVVRDHARRFRRGVEELIASQNHDLGDPHAVRDTVAVRDVASVRPAVLRLLALASTQHDLAAARAQALWFEEPWTLPDPPHRFGIVTTNHHMSVKTP